MTEHKSSYRNVLKATSLFGGVQVFNIIISIVRSKFIALFIGPTGMGIVGLLTTTLNLVNGVTNLGLDRSGVKDVSFVAKNGTDQEISRMVYILKRLVWVTGVIGAILMCIASPILSKIAFGNYEYTVAIIWVSAALLFKQLASGELAILQGLRKLNYLAKANIYGNFFGLLITVPLYYFFRIDAIVPAMIIASALSFIFTFYFRRKTKIAPTSVTVKEAFSEGKPMVKLGVTLSISSMITLLAAYVIQVYISAEGGVDEVGYYSAGMMILNSYVGLIFNAMGTDYYPRLAAIADSIEEVRKAVFEQAYIAVLLITPVIIVFLIFAPLIITILYSNEFLPVVGFVIWGILAMLFKAVSWSMGYVIIAKGDSNVFIKTAIGFSIILVGTNILGYYLGGLVGLGISFCIYYFIHYAALQMITYFKYEFYFKSEFYIIFVACGAMTAAGYMLTLLEGETIRYMALSTLAILSLLFSFYYLDKKMNLRELIQLLFRRKNDNQPKK